MRATDKISVTRKVFDVAAAHDIRITVPAVVVAEWWRSGEKGKRAGKAAARSHR